MYSFGTVVTVSPWHLGQAAWSSAWSRSYVELTCPWPERADMGVPMAACMAVTMGKLSPVPSDEQIALRRELLASSMTVAPSAMTSRWSVWHVVQLPARTGESCDLRLNSNTHHHRLSVAIESEVMAVARSRWQSDTVRVRGPLESEDFN